MQLSIDAYGTLPGAPTPGVLKGLKALRNTTRRKARRYSKGGRTWARIARATVVKGTRLVNEDPIAIHKQRGGIIKAKAGGYLTVPMTKDPRGARQMALRLAVTPRNLFLVNSAGRFMFVLKKQVKQRAYPFWPSRREALKVIRRSVLRYMTATTNKQRIRA